MHGSFYQVKGELFFWDGFYLNQFIKKNKVSRKASTQLPGANYYSWLVGQKELHSEHGEDSLELLKFACETKHGSRCNLCRQWVSYPPERYPYRFPDEKRPGKYCKLADTPTTNRKVDYCHPKVQAIVEHKEGQLKSSDEKTIDKFPTTFGVDEKVLKSYVLRLKVKE